MKVSNMRARGGAYTPAALTVALTLGLVGASPTTAASADEATGITADEAAAITQIGGMVGGLSTIGVTQNDIVTASPEQVADLESIVDLAGSSLTTDAASTSSAVRSLPSQPTDCRDTGALLAYARQAAVANSAHDAQAEDLDSETVYMYLSHFLDTPGFTSNPCAANAESRYLASWITTNDRTAYNNYLSSTNRAQLAADTGTLVVGIPSVLSGTSQTVTKAVGFGFGGVMKDAPNIADWASTAGSVHQASTDLVALLDQDKTPAEVISVLNANLSTTISDNDLRAAVIGTIAALATPGLGATMFGLGMTAASLSITGVNSLTQQAAVGALLTTTSSRLIPRMQRAGYL